MEKPVLLITRTVTITIRSQAQWYTDTIRDAKHLHMGLERK